MKEKIKEYLLEYMSRNSAEDIMYDIDELIEKERADVIEKMLNEALNRIKTHNNIFKEIGWENECIDISTIKIIFDELKEQKDI